MMREKQQSRGFLDTYKLYGKCFKMLEVDEVIEEKKRRFGKENLGK